MGTDLRAMLNKIDMKKIHSGGDSTVSSAEFNAALKRWEEGKAHEIEDKETWYANAAMMLVDETVSMWMADKKGIAKTMLEIYLKEKFDNQRFYPV